jgi:hypothetical protein
MRLTVGCETQLFTKLSGPVARKLQAVRRWVMRCRSSLANRHATFGRGRCRRLFAPDGGGRRKPATCRASGRRNRPATGAIAVLAGRRASLALEPPARSKVIALAAARIRSRRSTQSPPTERRSVPGRCKPPLSRLPLPRSGETLRRPGMTVEAGVARFAAGATVPDSSAV